LKVKARRNGRLQRFILRSLVIDCPIDARAAREFRPERGDDAVGRVAWAAVLRCPCLTRNQATSPDEKRATEAQRHRGSLVTRVGFPNE
jgi:hypothetical protein